MRISIAVLLLLGAARPMSAQMNKTAERAALARAKGAETATVTVYEIADFQCPYCGRFAKDVFPKIDSAFVKPGKVRWIFINFPLPTHAHSWTASEAAMCAGGVSGKFWQMHDKLFATQSTWSELTDAAPVFAKYAAEIGVPAAAYQSCVAGDVTASLVVRDLLNGASAGPTGTPAYVIGSDPIFAGYRTFEDWKELLEAALAKKK
ncbi:MAG TPA: thioredoxin domain-containing protein [Longimicrobiales bacterium]|nr:thioredoxin domain-containing protein [Longimicrobiales bacterium]